MNKTIGPCGRRAESDQQWDVVIALKRLELAKTRLDIPPTLRAEMAMAMALDTAAAVIASPVVTSLYVVCPDRAIVCRVKGPCVHVLLREPGNGLNAAMTYGRRFASRAHPTRPVALMIADLPAATTNEVTAVLRAIWLAGSTCVVSDVNGTGTVMLTAPPHVFIRPRFGAHSFLRHLEDGALAITNPFLHGLRRDVDSLDDLEDARQIGVGRHTSEVVRKMKRNVEWK